MTIEEKALREWGRTDQPEAVVWILADGCMINGCQGGFIRDVDHSEIGQFFSVSKFHEPGSNSLYIRKFIRRGNVRASCDGHECFFELARVPTAAQYAAMRRCMIRAMRIGQPVLVEQLGKGRGRRCWRSREEYEAYLKRYAPHVL